MKVHQIKITALRASDDTIIEEVGHVAVVVEDGPYVICSELSEDFCKRKLPPAIFLSPSLAVDGAEKIRQLLPHDGYFKYVVEIVPVTIVLVDIPRIGRTTRIGLKTFVKTMDDV